MLSRPFSFTLRPASIESSRILSWSSCLSPPAFTASIIIFSVAMNGSSDISRFSITFGYTTSPSTTFRQRSRIPSIARNPSGTLSRLFAESSSVLSNHCVADVIAGLSASIITYLERDAIRSLLIGFLLYAIADDPICVFSNGSSTSFKCWSRRMSLENLCALAAIPASTFSTLVSTFLE